MRNRKVKTSIILVLIFVIFWVIYGMYLRGSFKKSFVITTGKIIDIKGTWKNGNTRSILYVYDFKGEKKKGDALYERCGEVTGNKLKQILVGKHFSVAYSTATIGIMMSDILITRERANQFNYKLPDSLLIYDLIITCKE